MPPDALIPPMVLQPLLERRISRHRAAHRARRHHHRIHGDGNQVRAAAQPIPNRTTITAATAWRLPTFASGWHCISMPRRY
jgi:hypothetical protein